MSFEKSGIESWLIEALKKQHIVVPTPVQKLAIPVVLEGVDVMVEAPTGTGKTLAYLLPILSKLSHSGDHVQVLILAPTRELAIQITEEAKKLTNETPITLLTVYGGVDTQSQLKKVKRGIDVIVATPGRLMDLIRQEAISLAELKTLVLDEADQMVLLGFKQEVEWLIGQTGKKRQVLCFSATLAKDVKKLAYRYMNDPKVLKSEGSEMPLDMIQQKVVRVSDRWKTEALIDQMEKTNPYLGIIFCRTIRRVDKLLMDLAQRGFDVEKLHGDLSQNVRQRIMKAFKDGKFQYLITTDVASRGIDITGVTHIYNFDMPETVEIYVHRIGRTGRMGKDGDAITLVAPSDEIVLKELEAFLDAEILKETYERPEGFVDRSHNRH